MGLLLVPLFFNIVLPSILNTLRQMLAERVTTSISSAQNVGICRVAKYLYKNCFGFNVCFAMRAGLKEKGNRKTSKLQILGIQKERKGNPKIPVSVLLESAMAAADTGGQEDNFCSKQSSPSPHPENKETVSQWHCCSDTFGSCWGG